MGRSDWHSLPQDDVTVGILGQAAWSGGWASGSGVPGVEFASNSGFGWATMVRLHPSQLSVTQDFAPGITHRIKI